MVDHALLDARDHRRARREAVDDEELALEAVRDVVFASAGVGHGGHLERLGDLAEPWLLAALEDLEALVLDALAHEFERVHVALLVHFGHAQVVDEEHLRDVVLLGHERGALLLQLFLHCFLQQRRGSREREVDALEQEVLLEVEPDALALLLLAGLQQDVRGLGGSRIAAQEHLAFLGLFADVGLE